jgi:hypothetical protein
METRGIETSTELAAIEADCRTGSGAASFGRVVHRALLAVALFSALAMTLFWAGLTPPR